MKNCRLQIKLIILLSLTSLSSLANSWRREETFDYTPSHFIYPLASEVPGLGSTAGAGLTVNNMFGTDTDFTGVHATGDFRISLATILNIHLLKERLVLDVGSYSYDVAAIQFSRGPKSSKSDYILPQVEGAGSFGQLTLNFNERMFEFFVRGQGDESTVKAVYSAEGKKFSNVDNEKMKVTSIDYGAILDFTDHRYDPRRGLRFEALLKNPGNDDAYTSTISILDANVTAYIPLGSSSTWAFNYYQSDAIIQKQASTDVGTLRGQLSLGCDAIMDSAAKAECEATEDQRVEDRLAYNKYGRATPLGGSQRLGSFENGRFYAGHSRFIGSEIRWNLNQENSDFNYFIIKGVRTGFQLAFFAGVGGVADELKDLDYSLSSYGAGGRVIFKGGTVFRCDWATGKEGDKVTLFVDYPWGLSPVDNSAR